MKPVVIESPYAGANLIERRENELYAQRALDDALARGEAPFASHLLYPQVLDDNVPAQRRQGIEGQLAWIDLARSIVVYCDRGFSPGMVAAIRHCLRQGYEITIRTIASPPALAAWVDEELERAIPIRELLDDIRLQGPAWLAIDDLGAGEAPRSVETTAGERIDLPPRDNFDPLTMRTAGRIEPPPFAPTPPPAPQARPDGPASAWGSGNG
jgi:hypothetical protein